MFGQPSRRFETIDSTNDEANRWAQNGAPHGAVVYADEQTRGRGRQGRNWSSPAGLGLYVSLILRPEIELSRVPQLTMLAALGAARAVESETGLPSNVKWPNDIVLRGKKIGGVLSEARAANNSSRVEFAIIGIGLNINFAPSDLPYDVKIPASSLYLETGQVRSLEAVTSVLLQEIEKLYIEYLNGAWTTLRDEFVRRDILQNRLVCVETEHEIYEGRAAGIEADGVLLVQSAHETRRAIAGDVRLVEEN